MMGVDMATVLDGRALAQKIKDELKEEVMSLKKSTGLVPVMVNIMIGESHSSCAYANSQKKVAEYIGIDYKLKTLPLDTSQSDLIQYIEQLNADVHINGIMINKPVPSKIDYRAAANYVDTAKDLEGINVANIGKIITPRWPVLPKCGRQLRRRAKAWQARQESGLEARRELA